MKNQVLLFSYLIVSLIITTTSCNNKPVDVSDEIKKLNETFINSYNNGDTKTLGALYTENAQLFPSNSGVLEGRQTIEGFWGAVMQMGIKKAQMETVMAQSYGNIAIEEGRYKLFVDGEVIVDQGKYIVTWEKTADQWKIRRDIWNTNNPAPQARATKDEAIWIIVNYVKPNKITQFEDFNLNILKPAGDEVAPALTKTVRFIKSNSANQDGTYTYFFLMDPALKGQDYAIEPLLESKYGKEKAGEYFKNYMDCLKKSEVIIATQTGW